MRWPRTDAQAVGSSSVPLTRLHRLGSRVAQFAIALLAALALRIELGEHGRYRSALRLQHTELGRLSNAKGALVHGGIECVSCCLLHGLRIGCRRTCNAMGRHIVSRRAAWLVAESDLRGCRRTEALGCLCCDLFHP